MALVFPVPVSPVKRTGSPNERAVAIRDSNRTAGLCVANGHMAGGAISSLVERAGRRVRPMCAARTFALLEIEFGGEPMQNPLATVGIKPKVPAYSICNCVCVGACGSCLSACAEEHIPGLEVHVFKQYWIREDSGEAQGFPKIGRINVHGLVRYGKESFYTCTELF